MRRGDLGADRHRHPEAPLVQVGVQLDQAKAANGQLQMLAGSHRYNDVLFRPDRATGRVATHAVTY